MTALPTKIAASLPEDWTVAELGEAADLKNGSAFKPEDWKTTGVPIVRIQNLKDRDAVFNYFQGDPNSKVPLKNGDLVFSWSGSIGTSFGPHYWWGDLAVLNQHIFRVDLKPKTNLTKLFLYFALLHLTKEIESHAYGLAALVHVRKGDLEATRVPVPPLPEQRKIAGVLGVVQRTMEQQERLLALTAELKKALLHKLFTEGLHGEPHKETDIGRVPESWDLVPCQDLCEMITVGVVVKPASHYVEKGVPAFRSFNVREDRLAANDLVYFSATANDTTLAKSKLRAGDVLVVRTGYPGTSCVVSKEYDGANCIDLVIVRPKAGVIRSGFLSRYFNAPAGKSQAVAAKHGLAQQHLNVSAVKRTLVPVPSLEEQDEIDSALATVQRKIALITAKKDTLTALFRTLLHQLMTAQIRVHDLDLDVVECGDMSPHVTIRKVE